MLRLGRAAVLLGLWCAGCATPVGLQSAAPIREGRYQLGAHLVATPWCGGSPLLHQTCAYLPPRDAALSQFGVQARHGFLERWDVGARLSGQLLAGSAGPRAEAGFGIDAKRLLYASGEADTPRTVLSAALGAQYTSPIRVVFGIQGTPVSKLELTLPLFVGFEREELEWLVSPRLHERLTLADVNGDGRREVLDVTHAGLAVGVLGRGALRPGLLIEYSAPVKLPAQGALSLVLGGLWDLGEDDHNNES